MNSHTPHTILVTGATGQVGRHLVSELLSAGHRVRALSRTPETANLPEAVDVIAGDFGGELPAGLFKDVDAAFVFAADGAASFVEAAAAAQVPRLVLLSSL